MEHIPSLLSQGLSAIDQQRAIAQTARARRVAMRLTQADLAARAGVSLASLRRFERSGEGSIGLLLAIAETMGALPEFSALFPQPEATRLKDLEAPKPLSRVRKPRSKGPKT